MHGLWGTMGGRPGGVLTAQVRGVTTDEHGSAWKPFIQVDW